MNITKHDHQKMIMEGIRRLLWESNTLKQRINKAKKPSSDGKKRSKSGGGSPAGGFQDLDLTGLGDLAKGLGSAGPANGSSTSLDQALATKLPPIPTAKKVCHELQGALGDSPLESRRQAEDLG
eukprot:CAMPEP_0113940056 /NCGR_PEP_ID=MMETSP1339-20121228/6245_1 /TAXON_ID=94617 /ORGANISM="Fibrocapsa japonica" /LENGTH=123 /DNA_ID=CAMNT_0000943739 /DNA_START=110 /DNA_END=481 /DNA_ORIENTATION=+ /assembly_acc=CAM_ASM_000762